jgi:hypothetical protein
MAIHWIHEDQVRYYSVGIDDKSGLGFIEVVITSLAWRTFRFRLSDEELAAVRADPHALDDLADRLAADKGNHFYADRLLP